MSGPRGGVCSLRGCGVCSRGEGGWCVWSGGVYGPGGCLVLGGSGPRWSAAGGYLVPGVSGGRGGVCSQGVVSQHATEADTPLPL